jgi:hypothetical protein
MAKVDNKKTGTTNKIIGVLIVVIIALVATVFFLAGKNSVSSNYKSTIVSTIQGISTPTTSIQYPSICAANNGYYCFNPYLNSSTGNLSVTIEQDTGTNWQYADIVFVSQGTPTYEGIPDVLWTPPHAAHFSSFYSGYSYSNITLPVGAPGSTGIVEGTIWVQYQTTTTGPMQYVELASAQLVYK